jgi:hypothetical protein
VTTKQPLFLPYALTKGDALPMRDPYQKLDERCTFFRTLRCAFGLESLILLAPCTGTWSSCGIQRVFLRENNDLAFNSSALVTLMVLK